MGLRRGILTDRAASPSSSGGHSDNLCGARRLTGSILLSVITWDRFGIVDIARVSFSWPWPLSAVFFPPYLRTHACLSLADLPESSAPGRSDISTRCLRLPPPPCAFCRVRAPPPGPPTLPSSLMYKQLGLPLCRAGVGGVVSPSVGHEEQGAPSVCSFVSLSFSMESSVRSSRAGTSYSV